MKRKLMLIGGGGHCRSVLDSLMAMKLYDEIGIIDICEAAVGEIPVIGTDEDIPRLADEGWTQGFITVGSIGNTDTRRRLYELLKRCSLTIPSIIDPSAVIAADVQIGEGVYVGKRAVVNTGSILGNCSIINTGAIVEHDCRIGEFAHISPGAVACGQVTVGDGAHIGAGSVVRQGISIGAGSMIGAGSVVVQEIPELVKAYGNPCRVVKR